MPRQSPGQRIGSAGRAKQGSACRAPPEPLLSCGAQQSPPGKGVGTAWVLVQQTNATSNGWGHGTPATASLQPPGACNAGAYVCAAADAPAAAAAAIGPHVFSIGGSGANWARAPAQHKLVGRRPLHIQRHQSRARRGAAFSRPAPAPPDSGTLRTAAGPCGQPGRRAPARPRWVPGPLRSGR
jgi:hypothetical protein